MKTERIEFEGSEGNKLAGQLDEPDGKPVAYAVFAHCFACTRNFKAPHYLAKALTEQRIALFRFDFTGLGESEGEFAETSFASNSGDLQAASWFLARNYEDPKLIIGHSLGGAAAIQAAARIESCRAVVSIASPYDPAHVTHLFENYRSKIEEEGSAVISLGGRNIRIGREFVESLENERLNEDLRKLGRALLIFHSPEDETVGIENAARIYKSARHPKSFVSLDNADHLLSKEADARFVASIMAPWAVRYM